MPSLDLILLEFLVRRLSNGRRLGLARTFLENSQQFIHRLNVGLKQILHVETIFDRAANLQTFRVRWID